MQSVAYIIKIRYNKKVLANQNLKSLTSNELIEAAILSIQLNFLVIFIANYSMQMFFFFQNQFFKQKNKKCKLEVKMNSRKLVIMFMHTCI